MMTSMTTRDDDAVDVNDATSWTSTPNAPSDGSLVVRGVAMRIDARVKRRKD